MSWQPVSQIKWHHDIMTLYLCTEMVTVSSRGPISYLGDKNHWQMENIASGVMPENKTDPLCSVKSFREYLRIPL